MATFATTTSNFSDLVQETVAKAAEDELRAVLVHAQKGLYRPTSFIKGTNLVRLGRYADASAVTTALTEGTAPNSLALTVSSESFSATQVGAVFEITDLASLDSPHEVIAINAERAGRQAAKSIDALTQAILVAGTSVQYVTATSRATLAASNVITGAQVKKIVALLGNNDVPRFSDGFYRAIVHPFTVYDLMTDTATGGWMDANKYVTNGKLLTGEVGQYGGVRFLETSDAKVWVDGGASSVDTFTTIFLGTDAFTMADSQRLTSYYVPFGGDHSDPIAQLAKIGWKVRFGCALVDEAGPRYINLEHGASLQTS
ncbi:MAG: N4-gp56 family major capsid protein [Trueperaceae bacterium]|nr:N4-gp56 family major capsid protein [Trueperaceae bacterium]